ncbi:MAG TPA: VCBS repeat-containing protein [Blastocatellia bacterium]|nr:VCBS repeat-containing protein [Blastocatellia bacterium]
MSSRKKRSIYLISPIAVLAIVLLVVKVYLDRVEASARLLAETGQSAIKLLGEYKTGVERLDAEQVIACYDEGYSNEVEGFWSERLVSDRDGVQVFEWELDDERPFSRAEIVALVDRYLGGVRSIEEAKFKLDSVEETANSRSSVIRSLLWLRGAKSNGQPFESHALFRMWLKAENGEWRITKQNLIHGETVTGSRDGFTDITLKAGIDFISHQNPTWSHDDWYPRAFGIIKYGQGGVSVADYDNDGWEDIFFCDGTKPTLYHNNRNGSFSDFTVKAGFPKDMLATSVAIFADFNNDGYKDLFIGNGTDPNALYRNNGNGTFSDVSEGANLGGYFVTTAAVADYDRDGKLDIYCGRYLDPRTKLPTTLFYTRNGEGNTLLHNDGGFRFTDVTQRAGVREGGLALGLSWGDYNGDGWPDIYVANDFGRNALFRNNRDGTFADVTKAAGALDFGFGMSTTFGDIDNDGDFDLYISNVHSGQRWYGQAATLYQYLLTSVREGTMLEDLPVYREIYTQAGDNWRSFGDKMVKGNSLLINDGNGHFSDQGEATRTNPFGWYWSSTLFDYDNDGLQDIYAVDGWISGKKKDDL